MSQWINIAGRTINLSQATEVDLGQEGTGGEIFLSDGRSIVLDRDQAERLREVTRYEAADGYILIRFYTTELVAEPSIQMVAQLPPRLDPLPRQTRRQGIGST